MSPVVLVASKFILYVLLPSSIHSYIHLSNKYCKGQIVGESCKGGMPESSGLWLKIINDCKHKDPGIDFSKQSQVC
jgi:hypothetical protein